MDKIALPTFQLGKSFLISFLGILFLAIRRALRRRRYEMLKGKTVLITGGGQGLGRSMALRLAKLDVGCIIIWDINEETMARTTKEILAVNSNVEVVAARVDVGNKKAVETAKKELDGRKVDVLILNAGIVSGNSYIANIPEEKIRLTFDVNVMQLFFLSQVFLPDMIERDEGHIVTMASMSGMSGIPRMGDYCASKWAAYGFAESLRAELKMQKSNIATSVILPMFINTGMFKGAKPLLLTSMLKESDVSERVIQSIVGKEEAVGLPFWLPSLVLIGRSLPVVASDFLAKLLGVNGVMSNFQGH